MNWGIISTKTTLRTTVVQIVDMKRLITFLGLITLIALTSCKKQAYKGSYTGTEVLTVVSTTDSLSSTFPQVVTIDFSGSKCNYQSSTLIWEFTRKNKTGTGYLDDKTGTSFELEFKDDSLIASFFSDDQEFVRRVFRGKQY